ncbi:MAG: hypothetical protein HYZ14_07500 [Bacteroidetes bacterium]|nr:hypothetical protein [Bacteroidota bacterium]
MDLLKAGELVTDPSFGLTKGSIAEGEIQVETPTPNQIALDLNKMMTEGKAIERTLWDDEIDGKNITKENAEDFVNKMLKQHESYIRGGGNKGESSEEEQIEIEDE